MAVRNYHSNIELTKVVQKFLGQYKPEPKSCFQTAQCMALHDPRVEYVEGLVTSMIPMAHAWNAFEGVHFDLLEDVVWKDSRYGHYVQIVKLSDANLAKRIYKQKFYGNIGVEVFMDQAGA